MREYAKKPENQSRTLDSNPRASKQAPISQILQTYRDRTFGKPVQRQNVNEEELLQAKATQQDQVNAISQLYTPEEDDEILQGKFESTSAIELAPVQREEKPNNTGLPDSLKTGIENLSGYSMDDVKVHYNSAKPVQLNALAYTQGTDIHVASGQEKHLPHEAWHVVQQKQGRVQPTMQLQGVNVNDNEGLEREADVMGVKALRKSQFEDFTFHKQSQNTVQCIQKKDYVISNGKFTVHEDKYKTDSTKPSCSIYIEFMPNQAIGEDGDRVCLIQSVQDKIQLIGFESKETDKTKYQHSGKEWKYVDKKIPEVKNIDKNYAAGFELRLTDEGWAIDHVIFDAKEIQEKSGLRKIVNLDPRYTEMRFDDEEYRDHSDKTKVQSEQMGFVQNAKKIDGKWECAAHLSDEPKASNAAGRYPVGTQMFEVSAMLDKKNGEKSYLGSLTWGWELLADMSTKKSKDASYQIETKTLPIEVKVGVSEQFLSAAQKWNDMSEKDATYRKKSFKMPKIPEKFKLPVTQ